MANGNNCLIGIGLNGWFVASSALSNSCLNRVFPGQNGPGKPKAKGGKEAMIAHVLYFGGLVAIFVILLLVATSSMPGWLALAVSAGCVLAAWWLRRLWLEWTNDA